MVAARSMELHARPQESISTFLPFLAIFDTSPSHPEESLQAPLLVFSVNIDFNVGYKVGTVKHLAFA